MTISVAERGEKHCQYRAGLPIGRPARIAKGRRKGLVMKRRDFLAVIAAGTPVLAGIPVAVAALPEVQVWKSPSCGCCGAWADHMRAAGFTVAVTDTDTMEEVKARLGVTPALASCHTGQVAGYVLEGHVPADAVKRLLKERPQATGLAVPGMPHGSPGMETGMVESYDVVLFAPGRTSVFERR